MQVFCLGDTHIPERASNLPDWVMQLLVKTSPDRILFTGDVTDPSVLYLLEKVAPVYAVRGNMDRIDLPKEISLDLDGLRVLLIHGNQFGRGKYKELVRYAAEKDHNFVVCGHTHVPETFKEEGVVVVNPGS
ncbi:MAG: metallophosphoesterase family protein, partial [Candidatus Altiarchaeota archaeon]|nr:metallophosphoesterase family protein [Candidatus Altiarchaeota archaeon]